MRRIAIASALLAALALHAGCGPHHHTRHGYGQPGVQAALQAPTRVQGAIDPDVRLADADPSLADDTRPAELPDSVMLRGTVDDGYRDSLAPNY